MGGPFLVPIVEFTISHAEVVHLLCRFQDRLCWNKMGGESFLKVLPGAEGDWIFGERQTMLFLRPCACRSTWFHEGNGAENFLFVVVIHGFVQEVVCFEGGPEILCFVCGAVERVRG